MSHRAIHTNRWRKLRAAIVASALANNSPCGLCGVPLGYGDRIDVDHRVPLSVAPHLAFDPANLRPTHSRCNRSAGASMGNRARRNGGVVVPALRTTRDW